MLHVPARPTLIKPRRGLPTRPAAPLGQINPRYRFVWREPGVLYPFWRDGGTTIRDYSEREQHAALQSHEAADWTVGRYGEAVRFDGVDEYGIITAGGTLPIGNNAAFSVAVLYRSSSATAALTLWSEGSDTDTNPRIRLRVNDGATGDVHFACFDDAAAGYSATSANVGSTDGRYHLLVGVQRSKSAGGEVWFDGRRVATGSGTVGTLTTQTSIFAANYRGGVVSAHFAGDLAMLLLARRAWTDDEIRRLFLDPFGWARPMQRRAVVRTVGGTLFTLDVGGGLTPSGGLVKRAAKVIVGNATPTGALVRSSQKQLSGSTALAGGLTRHIAKLLAGGTAPSGALARRADKMAAGSIASDGALAKRPVVLLGGAATPAGSLSRHVGKLLSGGLTPGGALASAVTRMLALAGTAAPAGGLTRRPGKVAAGAVTSGGSLGKRASLTGLGGTLTSVGSLLKRAAKALSGGFGSGLVPPSTNLLAAYLAKNITGLADGAPVATWEDSGPNGYDATQATAAKRPVWVANAINGHPGVRFPGAHLLAASFGATKPLPVTIAAFVRYDKPRTDYEFLVDGLASGARWAVYKETSPQKLAGYYGNGSVLGHDSSPGTWFYQRVQGRLLAAGADSIRTDDGSTVVTDSNNAAGDESVTGLTIGARFDDTLHLDGVVTAILVYQGAELSSTQLDEIDAFMEQYFSAPLGIIGALTALKVVGVQLAGAIAPTATVVRRAAKVVAGGITPASTLVRQARAFLAGTAAAQGTASKRVLKAVGGTASLAGTLATAIIAAVGGAWLEFTAYVSAALDFDGHASPTIDADAHASPTLDDDGAHMSQDE